jgi:hypothetical protein
MLAVLKTVRRSQPAASRGGVKRSPGPGRIGVGRSDPQDQGEVSKRPQEPWLQAEEALLRGLCQRFLTAGLAQARARRATASEGEDEAAEPPPPVVLHPRAAVLAAYQIQWPGVYRDKLAGETLDAMEVSYVRTEDQGRLRTVQGHYERNLKPHQLHPLADGVRIEALQVAAKDGRIRSIDVLVTRANPKADRPLDEPEQLTVEILSVAIPALQAGPGSGRRMQAEPQPVGLP